MAPPTSRSKAQDKQLASALKEEIGGGKVEKLNLGDTASLKRALDDAVSHTVSSSGYLLDYKFVDIKIVLGVLACLVACVAQFWPGKYPETRWVLLTCVGAYAALSAAMSAVASLLERDMVVLTVARLGQPALCVRSSLPRFQDVYTLAVRPRGAKAGGPGEASMERSVGAYFDRDGVLDGEAFRADVAALLGRATAEKPKGQ